MFILSRFVLLLPDRKVREASDMELGIVGIPEVKEDREYYQEKIV